MTRRAVATVAVALLGVLGPAGCGVSTEDEPQPVEDTSIQQAPATPSVATRPAPTTSAAGASQSSPPPSPGSARP